MTHFTLNHLRNRSYSISQRHRWLIRACHGRGIFPIERAVVTFRPRGKVPLAFPERFRELGTTEMLQLTYVESRDGLQAMPLKCYRRHITHEGLLDYGSRPPIFRKNGLYVPRRDAHGACIDLNYDERLAEMLIQMHYACVQHHMTRRSMQLRMVLPKLWLGFPENKRPSYEDTPALRERAAQKLGMAIQDLGQNGEEILQEYLQILWQEQWIDKNHSDNTTGLELIEARFCTNWQASTAYFEDFQGFRGATIPSLSEHVEPNGLSIAELRERLAMYWSQCASDHDLERAIAQPELGLHASHAPRMQVLQAAAAID
jgi:hypothetical protein